jgi:phosphatidylglycerophosphatase C
LQAAQTNLGDGSKDLDCNQLSDHIARGRNVSRGVGIRTVYGPQQSRQYPLVHKRPVPIAVFDFDLTLTSWDTATRFFGWLLRRSPWKPVLGAPIALLIGPLAAFRRTRRVPIRFAAWLATLGHDHEPLRALVKVHISEIGARHGSFLRRDGRAQLEAHQSQGHTVVVATGAFEDLARDILVNEGFSTVIVVGSSLRRVLGGMVVNRHCHGPHKIPMLQERGFEPPWAFVYSDHEADLPLLRSGIRQFVVNPKPRTAARLMAVLGPSATVVTWR